MPPRRRRSLRRFTSPAEIPLVCYSQDVARLCGKTLPTIWRKIRDGDWSAFPPPTGTNPYTWLKADLLAYLQQSQLALRRLRRLK